MEISLGADDSIQWCVLLLHESRVDGRFTYYKSDENSIFFRSKIPLKTCHFENCDIHAYAINIYG